MNRNLKRVLALALTLAVMAVNFTIAALAADITVSYDDLPTAILGQANANQQQGILFFETTPGTSNAGSGLESTNATNGNNRVYAPLDVWIRAQNASLNMKASEWVRYEVTAAEAGYYSVGINYGCNAAAGADFTIRTDSNIVETHLTRSGSSAYTWSTVNDLGYLYLAAGTNYVYVHNTDSTSFVNFRELTFTKDASADATMVKWLAPVEAANEIADLTVAYDDGYNQVDVSGATVTFPMSIATEGKYKVSVMGIAGASNSVSADFGADAKEATVANDAYGYAEIGVFPLTAGDYTLTLGGFTDYSLAWAKVEYVGTYITAMTSESITDGDTVSRGIDSYIIEFNDSIDDVDAASQVTLESTNGTIDVETLVENNKLTVSFKETLDYSTPYTLTITGLKGLYDEVTMADKVVNFTTDADTNTAGTATVEVTDISSYREDGTVTGVVKGSTGVGIKGRTVTVLDSTSGTVATGVSGDDGLFTLDFTITEPAAGVYTYTVNSEYGATSPATVTYVSEAEEIRILGLFANAATASDVAAILGPNAGILGVPSYATDIAGLSNADLFHNHFIGKTFTAVTELAPYYSKMLLMEQMNQSTTGSYVATNFFNQYSVCKQLGFDMDKLALIDTSALKSSLATAYADVVRANGPCTTEEAFLARVDTVIRDFLLSNAGISATTLDITGYTTSLYYGGEISIPLKLNDVQTKVAAVVVTVDASDAAVLANAQTVIGDAADTSVSVSGNTATFRIDYNYQETKQYSDLGRLALQGSVLGSHTFTVNAEVIYRLEKTVEKLDENGDRVLDASGHAIPELKAVELSLPAPGSSFSASVATNPTDNGRDYGNGGGGYVAPPKEVKPEDEEQGSSSVYFFDDMGDAAWAQDMVHTLVGKGVISKNNERAFRPMDNITREEYVKMLITVIGSHDPNAVSDLSDVGANHWATSYIATAQKLGIVQGNADGSFGVGTNITRQDMAVMIYRTFEMLGIDLSAGDAAFADSNEISNYAKDAVSALTKLGILNGMGDNTFAPGANATRAQAAKVIYVMMEVLGV